MIFEPSMMVFYVENVLRTSIFYQEILGIKPEVDSATFHRFMLSNGMSLALKAKHEVVPSTAEKSGNGELAFMLESRKKVDELCAQWQAKKITIIASPTQVPFGYTFVALDPDGYRLRVVALGAA